MINPTNHADGSPSFGGPSFLQPPVNARSLRASSLDLTIFANSRVLAIGPVGQPAAIVGEERGVIALRLAELAHVPVRYRSTPCSSSGTVVGHLPMFPDGDGFEQAAGLNGLFGRCSIPCNDLMQRLTRAGRRFGGSKAEGLTIQSETIGFSKPHRYISPSVQSRASTDWPAPTCASPSKVVRKRGRCPSGTRNQAETSMAPARRFWKGYLKLSLVPCPIALFTGTSSTERVSFCQIINKKTGHRSRRRLVDEVTREPVEGGAKSRGTSGARRTPGDPAPILMPARIGDRTYGDHLRHLAGHSGAIPLTLDEFGRCAVCVRLGWFRPNG
jgi:hypothetical protein